MAGKYGRTIGRISVKVLPDASKFRDDIKKIVERAEKQNRVHIPVEADTREASRQLDEFYRQWERQTLEFRVNIEQRAAEARLDALSRNRTATIKVKTENKGLAAAEGFLKRISGFRVAVDLFHDVNQAILNLDKSVGTISRLGLSIASLTSSVISLAGGLITTSGDLLKIVNLALLGPAAFAGFGVGVTALVIGLKTMGDELAELGPGFQRIKKIIQTNFWAEARQPILDLVNNVFPALRKGMGAVSGSIGRQMGTIATALQGALGGGVLEKLFGTLVQTIDIVTGAMDPLVKAFVKMGEVGSTFLPGIAKAFVDVSNKFNDWVQATAASGEMFRFIQEGLDNLVLAAQAVGAVAGIFRALDAAATGAGAGGLKTFTSALQGAADILKSPEVQNGLTTLFSGAQVAVSQVGKGISDIGAALVNMAPTFAGAFAIAGTTIGGLLSTIADALQRPVFQKGLTDLFVGIQQGVEGIKPAIPAIADILGKLGTLVGTLAAAFGPLVGTIKTTFAPALESIIDVVNEMVPIISGELTGAISALKGPVEAIANLFNGNRDAIAGFASKAIPAVVAIALIGKTFSAIKGFVTGFSAALKGVQLAQEAVTLAQKRGLLAGKVYMAAMKVWGVATKVFTGIWKLLQLAFAISPFGVIVLGIAALVAGFIWAYKNIKPFRDFIQGLGKLFGEIGGHIAAGLTGAWQAVTKWFGDVINGFKGWVDGIKAFFGIHSPSTLFRDIALNLIAGLVNGFKGLLSALSGAWSGVTGFFSGIFNGIKDVISSVVGWVSQNWPLLLAIITGPIGLAVLFVVTHWGQILDVFKTVGSAIVGAVTTAFNAVLSFIQGFIGGVVTIWNGFWNGLVAVVGTVWSAIAGFVSTYLGQVQLGISTAISVVGSIWSGFWNGLVSVVSTVWSAIAGFVTTYLAQVQLGISTAIGVVSSVWSAFWNGLSSVASTVFSAIVGFVTTYLANVQLGITTAIGVVKSVWSAGWNAVKSVVTTVFGAVVGFVSSVVNSVKGTISAGVSVFTSVWSGAWRTVSSAVSSVVGSIGSLVGGMVSTVKGKVGEAVSAFTGIKDKVVGFFTGAGGWLVDAGSKIVGGLISGITSMIGKAGDAIGSVMGKISSFLPHSPAKTGPFSGKGWTPYSGRALVEGLADGMESRTDRVRKAALAMVKAASADIPGIDLSEGSTGLQAAAARQAAQLQLVAAGTNVTIQGDVGYDPQQIADEIDIRKRQAQMSVDFDSLIAP